jgi:hypothetical protein
MAMITLPFHGKRNRYTARMTRRLNTLILAAAFLYAPALASADAYGVQPTLGQLLSRLSALYAIQKDIPVACAVSATKTTVQSGEQFTLAWGSYGADPGNSTDPKNAYPNNGETAVILDTQGTRTYEFVFFGTNGKTARCEQSISVL